MIDFIRIYFTDKERIDKYIKDGRRKSIIQRQSRDGEDITYTTWIQNLKLVSTPKTTYLEGSLHAFHNALNGLSHRDEKRKWVNYNDFTFRDLMKVLDVLNQKLGYDLSQTTISTCELGYNINIDVPAKEFIDRHVFMYKLKYPCYDPKYKEGMKMKKYDLENYYLKIYDKSLQFGLSEHILRFEIGFRSDELRECDVHSLADLADEDSLDLLHNSLMKKYNDLLILDRFDGFPTMSESERDMMRLYTNPQFWVDSLLRANKSKYNDRSKDKAEFERIVRVNKLDTKKLYLRNLVIEKYNYLISN
ncbi:MAG: hypothetical protein ACK5KT_08290 [Dysgonomonas sp.]